MEDEDEAEEFDKDLREDLDLLRAGLRDIDWALRGDDIGDIIGVEEADPTGVSTGDISVEEGDGAGDSSDTESVGDGTGEGVAALSLASLQ